MKKDKSKWHIADHSNRTWTFETRDYIYEAANPMNGRYGFIARRSKRTSRGPHEWIQDIDKNGNPVRGCTLGYTSLKEAKRRCSLLKKKRKSLKSQ